METAVHGLEGDLGLPHGDLVEVRGAAGHQLKALVPPGDQAGEVKVRHDHLEDRGQVVRRQGVVSVVEEVLGEEEHETIIDHPR